jgi:hypothetical protein
MNRTKHSPSRLVDVTDQTGVTSSQAAAAAARPNDQPRTSRHARNNRC